jgi:putative transposase
MMRNVSGQFHYVCQLAAMLLSLIVDTGYYLGLCLRPSPTLAAENLFLRKQLALYQERHVKPQRATHATRIALVWLGQRFDWRQVLGIVKPETIIRWHRQGFRLFWRWQSKPGQPALPKDLQVLIRRMALDTPRTQ